MNPKSWLASAIVCLAFTVGPSEAQQPTVRLLHWDTDFPSRTMIFLADESPVDWRNPPPVLFRTRLFVPLNRLPGKPAAFAVRLQFDCAAKAESAAYFEYEIDGAETRQLASVPLDLVDLTREREPNLIAWRRLCDRMPVPPAPALNPALKYKADVDHAIVATSVGDAITRGTPYAKLVDAALALPQTGRFLPLRKRNAFGEVEAYMLDLAAYQQVDNFVRLSWISFRRPSHIGGYFRHSYLVDCATSRARRELRVTYEEDGRPMGIQGASVEAPFTGLVQSDFLNAACKLGSPTGENTISAVKDAVAAGRREMQ